MSTRTRSFSETGRNSAGGSGTGAAAALVFIAEEGPGRVIFCSSITISSASSVRLLFSGFDSFRAVLGGKEVS